MESSLQWPPLDKSFAEPHFSQVELQDERVCTLSTQLFMKKELLSCNYTDLRNPSFVLPFPFICTRNPTFAELKQDQRCRYWCFALARIVLLPTGSHHPPCASAHGPDISSVTSMVLTQLWLHVSHSSSCLRSFTVSCPHCPCSQRTS